MRIALYSATVATVLLASSAAHAANGSRPRTQPIWDAAPCLEVVDKAETPVFHVAYTVAKDELELTNDELPDSRTHQFFAFGKLVFDYGLPTYINQSDHDRAEANGDNTMMYGPDDILDTSSIFPAHTFVRITPDDARVPITHEQASLGVQWDLADVLPGPYVIAGYTWEPEQNAWSWRMGLVQVVDPLHPGEEGPAVFALTEPALAGFAGDEIEIDVCVHAHEGATITASWGLLTGNESPTWTSFLSDEPVINGEQQLAFTIPPEANNSLLKIRVAIDDGQGRSYTAFTPFPVEVQDDGSQMGTTSGGESGDDDVGDTAPETGASDTSDENAPMSLGCRSGGAPAALGLLLLPLLVRRRREDD